MRRGKGFVEGDGFAGGGDPGVGGGVGDSVLTALGPLVWPGEQIGEVACAGGGVEGVDVEGGVSADFGEGTGAAAQDGGAAGHGFKDGKAEAFVAGGKDIDGGGLVGAKEVGVIDVAAPFDVVFDSEFARGEPGFGVAWVFGADDAEAGFDALAKEKGIGMNEQGKVFIGVASTDEEDDGIGGEVAGGGFERGEAGMNAFGDDVDFGVLFRGEVKVVEDVGASGLAYGDDGIGVLADVKHEAAVDGIEAVLF